MEAQRIASVYQHYQHQVEIRWIYFQILEAVLNQRVHIFYTFFPILLVDLNQVQVFFDSDEKTD